MTGYTVHTGASKKFVSGWDRIFSGNQEAQAKTTGTAKKATAKKKAKASVKASSKKAARKKK